MRNYKEGLQWKFIVGGAAILLIYLSTLVIQEKLDFGYERSTVLLVFTASIIFLISSFFTNKRERWITLNHASALLLVTMSFFILGMSLGKSRIPPATWLPLALGIVITGSQYLRFGEITLSDDYLIILLSCASFWYILNKFAELGIVGLLLAANTALLIAALSYMVSEEDIEDATEVL